MALDLQPTTAAHWHTLIKDAGDFCSIKLDEDLESYLVFLLMRFTRKPEMAASVLALEFLTSIEANGQNKSLMLRDVGDKCLLYSGFFPGRAERLRVRASYFVTLGQNAYASLSDLQKEEIAKLYHALAQHFVSLMDVLLAIRELAISEHSLLPLQAEELWHDTDSQIARDVLQSNTHTALPIRRYDNKVVIH